MPNPRHLPSLLCKILCLASCIIGLASLQSLLAQTSASVNVATYDQLVSAIRDVRHQTEARIETAVEQEKVREAWETGKLIDEHILLHKERQDYGDQVVIRLAKDLGTSESELRYILQFARSYPIHPPADELSWSHYRELLSINDSKERVELTAKAAKQHWTRNQVREEVRKRTSLSSPNDLTGDPGLSEIKPGKTGVYRVIEKNGKKYYDLGLSTFIELKGRAPKEPNPPLAQLYTYHAQVINVYDGDTFHARIDLGFGVMTEQRVRLLRVDAPEIESSDGKEAKAALEKILARDKGRILIQTFEMDQHGRPLANVWVNHKSVDEELFDQGLVTRMAE